MIATLFRYRDQGRFALHAFAIMPDHLHVLITPAIDQSTARCIQFIKGGYSFAVRSQFPGEVWHSGYHEHRIRDEDDFEAQKQYIANNPIRKNYLKLPPRPHLLYNPPRSRPGRAAHPSLTPKASGAPSFAT
jgi:putative transposase